MDVESEKAVGKQATTETLRPPLVSADNKNGTTRRSRTREVSSRYMSPTPSAASVPKRCPSPSARRPPATSTVSLPKGAVSAERKRPSTPSSPPSPSPSTPVKDIAAAMLLTPRKTPINKSPESLWPSTMRSLSVSFQSDAYAVPTGKKEKTVSRVPSDRTLKPSSNVARKSETPAARKSTPEKKRSPLRGKNYADQSENSKPVDSLSPRLVDQHRWPSRTSVRTSTFPSRSDVTEKVNKPSPLSHSRMVTPPHRRLSLDGTSKPVQKSASDFVIPTSHVESGKETFCGSSFHDGSQKVQRPSSSSSSERTSLMNAAGRTHSLPIPRSRPSSPSVSRGISPSRGRIVTQSSRGTSPARVRPSSPSRQPQDTTSVSRGISPSRGRIVTPSSRGTSPARVRPSSPSRQPQDTTSVLSFIADIKKSKKAANDIEDVHQLRLLYNRHLQWRYAFARTYAAMHSQKAKAEKMLYNIWRIILDLSDSVRKKRSNLQQLKLKLNLYSVLVNQAGCLDEWASIERDHTNSLTWAIQDLQASTLRIPVTEGTRVDMKSVKGAVCSAVHVMKAMASSLRSILPQVEGTNSLVSELADVAARERAMLNECESLFGSIAALQVEEHSLRTHLLQAWRGDQLSIF